MDGYAVFINDTAYSSAVGCEIESSGYASRGNLYSYKSSRDFEGSVVCISYDDAKAYALWLSRVSGRNYRLLSESEWEYVATQNLSPEFVAGTTTEWIEDCWHDNYLTAPSNGAALSEKYCSVGVLRGGISDQSNRKRTKSRRIASRAGVFDTTGFRVARALPQ
jgi:formylglycine-generating enzyme required for sulfatase activity